MYRPGYQVLCFVLFIQLEGGLAWPASRPDPGSGEKILPKTSKLTENQNKLATLDSRIHDLQSHQLASIKSNLDHTQQEIRTQQETIAKIEAELQNGQEELTEQLKTQELKNNEETVLLQSELSELRENMKFQEQMITELDQQIRFTVAPNDSDLITSLRNRMEEEQAKLDSYRNQYASLLLAQQNEIAEEAENSKIRQDEWKSEQINLHIAETDAKSELARLQSQAEHYKFQQDQVENELAQLKAERRTLGKGIALESRQS